MRAPPLVRSLQNVPATANCTMSPLKRMMETVTTSINTQRKTAGHRGMKAPVNMENYFTLAEAACRHKSKYAVPTLCSGAHGERRPARGKIRGSRHVPTSSELPGDDNFHDLVFKQNDAGGDDKHQAAADRGGSPGNKDKHGNFLCACQGGREAIKIENRS